MKNVTIGYSRQPQIEASETVFFHAKTSAKKANQIRNTRQSRRRIIAAAVTTPLPPRKPK